jgi:hypothetical protein
VEISATLLADMHDNSIIILGIERNINERKNLEAYIYSQHQELRDSEEKYRYITENSKDLI